MLTRGEIYEAESLLKNLATSNVHKKHRDEIERLLDLIEPLAERERAKEYTEELNIDLGWQSYDPRRKLQEIISTLKAAETFHREAKKTTETYERETQDILHALEITEPTDKEKVEYADALQELRIKRRIAKDFMEMVKPVIANLDIITEIDVILDQVNEVEQGLKSRTYKIRERKTLKEAFERAKGLEKKTSLQEAFEKAAIS